MIKVDKIEVYGWEAAIRGMRNPKNSWDRSECGWEFVEDPCIINPNDEVKLVRGENDLDLMRRLYKGGSEHRKYLRMINVTMDIVAPLYWWKEYDTYKVATVANSTSTMHKIHAKPFDIDDFSHDHMTPSTLTFIQTIVDELEKIRLKYMEEGKNKEDWYDMIQLLPSSYNQMRTVTMNYETLINIYFARRMHKLQEWHTFCDWIKTLPYAEEIIIAE